MSETKAPTVDEYREAIERELAKFRARIATAQSDIVTLRECIKGNRARIAELKRMRPRKARAK